jgi:hypothetical protein
MKLLPALVVALGAAGCSTAIDSVPSWAGGEPQGVPQRVANEMEYPPVHQRPPAPANKIVTVEEQTKIERELAAARDAQAKRAAQVKKDRADMLANQPKPHTLPPPPSPAAPGT